MLELLKNSMRAVVERHAGSKQLPHIHVIADVDRQTNDLLVRVRDVGGGIDQDDMEKIWSYMFTTVEPKTQEVWE
jgi:nitrogen fixation/metabolism regulation signal transduction histidine kinase